MNGSLFSVRVLCLSCPERAAYLSPGLRAAATPGLRELTTIYAEGVA